MIYLHQKMTELQFCAGFIFTNKISENLQYVNRQKLLGMAGKGYALNTVKPVLSGYSKMNKTKVLMTNGSLMKVKILQNAPIPLEHSAIILTCIK